MNHAHPIRSDQSFAAEAAERLIRRHHGRRSPVWAITCTGIIMLAVLAAGRARADSVSQAETSLFSAQLRMARSGDPNGEFYVGKMYQDGLGTQANLQLAHQWYERAARQGNAEAKQKLANWNQILQNAQKAKAQELAAQRAAILAKEQAAVRAAALAKARAQARIRAAQAARAAAIAKRRAAAMLARQRAEAAAAAAARKREHEQAAALQARKIADEKARAEAEARQRAIAEARSRKAAQAHKMKLQASAPPHQAKTGDHFSPDPCKGPAARFLSTCQ